MEIITKKIVALSENEIIHLQRAASVLEELDDVTCGELDWEIEDIVDALRDIALTKSWKVEFQK